MAAPSGSRRWRLGVPALAVQAALAAITLRDLAARPDSAIRGPRRVWQLVATVNTAGTLAYWVIGRRRS